MKIENDLNDKEAQECSVQHSEYSKLLSITQKEHDCRCNWCAGENILKLSYKHYRGLNSFLCLVQSLREYTICLHNNKMYTTFNGLFMPLRYNAENY